MELPSVLALRDEILTGGPRTLAPEIYAGLPEATAEAIDFAPFPVSLGIVGRPGGECRLAVRATHWDAEIQVLVERIRQVAADEVEVRRVGPIEAQQTPNLKQRNRPLRIGCSCAHRLEALGTLGCFVRRPGVPGLFLLSNNHVFAQENHPEPFKDVLQPAIGDMGTQGDRVAELVDFIALTPQHNVVDAAIAKITGSIETDRRQLLGLGQLSGIRAAPLVTGDTVFKVGRTTSKTEGRVRAWDLPNVEVRYGGGVKRFFDHQTEIDPLPGQARFSDRGDSGSLLVDVDLRAAGLLFSGAVSGNASYANQIGRVFELLNLELAL